MMPRLVIGPLLLWLPPFAVAAFGGRCAGSPPRQCSRLLTVASLATGSGAPALVAIEPQFLVENILHRETRGFVLALEVRLHLLALFVLLDRLYRKPDTPLATIDLHHDSFYLFVDLEQRGRLVDTLVT